jgi:hypothetical protein
VEGIAIRFRVDRNRPDTQFPAREQNAESDLSAVCDQYLAEHQT